MNEIITINGVEYTTRNITTGINTISFTLNDPIADAEFVFRNVKELTVGDKNGTVYGQYPDVEFESLTIGADGNVTITMHIPTEIEKQIKELQVSYAELRVLQAEQDEVIAELYGGEAQ